MSISFIPDWVVAAAAAAASDNRALFFYYSNVCISALREGWQYFVASFRLYSLFASMCSLGFGQVFHINLFYYFYIIVMDTHLQLKVNKTSGMLDMGSE